MSKKTDEPDVQVIVDDQVTVDTSAGHRRTFPTGWRGVVSADEFAQMKPHARDVNADGSADAPAKDSKKSSKKMGVADATPKAKEILAAAKEEADKMVSDAKIEADGIIGEAIEMAKGIINDAQSLAGGDLTPGDDAASEKPGDDAASEKPGDDAASEKTATGKRPAMTQG